MKRHFSNVATASIVQKEKVFVPEKGERCASAQCCEWHHSGEDSEAAGILDGLEGGGKLEIAIEGERIVASSCFFAKFAVHLTTRSARSEARKLRHVTCHVSSYAKEPRGHVKRVEDCYDILTKTPHGAYSKKGF